MTHLLESVAERDKVGRNADLAILEVMTVVEGTIVAQVEEGMQVQAGRTW